jgi:hemolysin III
MDTTTITSIVEFDAPLGTAARPLWRGRLHVLALLAAVPVFATLIVVAQGGRARAGAIVYAAGVLSMFLVSATYHRWVHTIRARRIWRRADHATIYAAIAGTFTPMCLTAVRDWRAPWLLVLMWGLAFVGMSIKVFGWRHERLVGGSMYILLGWLGVVVMPALWRHWGLWPTMLLLVGGIFYTLGAVLFHRQWPKLCPEVFSYHEVWHVCTVVAAFSHLAAVWLIVA